jgi:hypothetical protein
MIVKGKMVICGQFEWSSMSRVKWSGAGTATRAAKADIRNIYSVEIFHTKYIFCCKTAVQNGVNY